MGWLMPNPNMIDIDEYLERAPEITRGVEETARPVIIARRGRPVVEIRAIDPVPDSLFGSVSVSAGVDLTEPTSRSPWAASARRV